MLIEEEPPRTPRRRGRPGGRALIAAAAAALVLHGALLGAEEKPAPAPSRSRAVNVRTVEVPLPVEAPAAVAVTPPAPRLPPPRGQATQPAAIAVAAAVAAPAERADSIPVYRTSLPAPATLSYEMKRGFLSGTGALHWRPAGGRYETRLEGHVAGVHVLTETSTGTLDAHGLAPLRYTDWRARRSTSAANFQRDKGRITYSGPQVENPLPPGAQDRVSWMVQIGAVLNAEPKHAAPGGRIAFFVSGAQGDADLWTFRYVGSESVTTRLGALRAVRFTREPRKTYDRQVDVWLAPDRQHLPVRARFTTQADGEVFELLLRDIQPP